MKELSINDQLVKEDLFVPFADQLKKDFETCALSTEFVHTLPREFYQLKDVLIRELAPLFKSSSSSLSSLLYRIDISEGTLHSYQKKNEELSFEEVVAELIIKRILQKVILKKTFSK
ncbi:MAG: hypothetical protein PSX36_06505 [bacterium]|nr:hypothetical protein [bacterium]